MYALLAKRLFWLFLILDCWLGGAGLVQADANPVVINEVMFNPVGVDTGHEWIELFNPSCATVDLTGYELTTAGDDYIFSNYLLQPQSFVVIHWRGEGVDRTSDLFTGQAEFDTNLGNSAGSVVLFNSSKHSKHTLVDFVQYGRSEQSWETSAIDGGVWYENQFISVSEDDQVIQRQPDGVDTNQAADWQVTDVASPGEASESIDPPIDCDQVPSTKQESDDSNDTTTNAVISSTASAPVFDIQMPHAVETGSTFVVSGTVSGLVPHEIYSVKFEASADNGSTWYAGRTQAAVDNEMLAWNQAWERFPKFETTTQGELKINIQGQLKQVTPSNDCLVQIKIRRGDSGDYLRSEPQKVNVTPSMISLDQTEASDGDAPMIGIDSIDQLRMFDLGTSVLVKGVVIAEVGKLGVNTLYIHDDTGGVRVEFDKSVQPKLNLEEEVQLRGTIKERYNERYIKVSHASAIKVIDTKEAFASTEVQTGTVDEQAEGWFVLITGQVVSTSGDTFYLDDGTGEVRVYIKESTNIDKPYMRTGYYAQVQGVVSQYQDYYRILPIHQADIYVSKTPIPGKVLGSVLQADQLPATGSYAILWSVLLLTSGLAFRIVTSSYRIQREG